jgi:hypothetical protein
MDGGAGARLSAQSRAPEDRSSIKPMRGSIPSNFGLLQVHDAPRVRFGLLAEQVLSRRAIPLTPGRRDPRE